MKTAKGMLFTLVAVVLLAGWVGANTYEPATDVSGTITLDTRSKSSLTVNDDKDLNTRSFSVDWSDPMFLSTKKIVGTMILMR